MDYNQRKDILAYVRRCPFLFRKEKNEKKSAPATGRLIGRCALLLRGLALGVLRGQIRFNGMIFAERENKSINDFVSRVSLEAAREGSAESRASDLLGGRGFLGYFFCRHKKSDEVFIIYSPLLIAC